MKTLLAFFFFKGEELLDMSCLSSCCSQHAETLRYFVKSAKTYLLSSCWTDSRNRKEVGTVFDSYTEHRLQTSAGDPYAQKQCRDWISRWSKSNSPQM